jgi:hypothetical protein
MIETALAGEIGDDGGQQGLNVAGFRLREGDDPEPVTDRRWQRIEAVGGGDIADLAKIERDLQGGIGIAAVSLRFEEAEQAIPQPAIVPTPAGRSAQSCA